MCMIKVRVAKGTESSIRLDFLNVDKTVFHSVTAPVSNMSDSNIEIVAHVKSQIANSIGYYTLVE